MLKSETTYHMIFVHEQKAKSNGQCKGWLDVTSHRHVRTLAQGSLEGPREQVLHGVIVEENPTQDSQVPDIVAATDIIEKTWLPALRNFGSVDTGTDKIHHDALHDWCIEIHGP